MVGVIKPLSVDDALAMHRILAACGVVTADLQRTDLGDFIGLFERDALLAVGGLQHWGSDALLRSLATVSAARRRGFAAQIVSALETQARAHGARSVYLLTESAQHYFERRGYQALPRSAAPAAIRACPQFATVCPASAVFMGKKLLR